MLRSSGEVSLAKSVGTPVLDATPCEGSTKRAKWPLIAHVSILIHFSASHLGAETVSRSHQSGTNISRGALKKLASKPLMLRGSCYLAWCR